MKINLRKLNYNQIADQLFEFELYIFFKKYKSTILNKNNKQLN